MSLSPSNKYSLGEEIAHGLTHGVGIVLAIAGLCVLVTFSALYGSAVHVVASSIFGASMIVLYTASTLYHSLPMPETKRIMRVVDHASIYLLIAGTYTPFTLVTLEGAWGWSLFGVVWGLAIAGIIFKLFFTGRFDRLSVAIYVAMGWCGLVAIKPMMAALPTLGLWLLVAGGLAYTGGVIFYLLERMRYHHAIWHLFVMAGTTLHYFVVLFFVIPGPT
ncbi:MAG: hemolysin III family protein [Polycyclovorans sp.]|nr:hemolysin III family protein [Gammaproteobacteria bacterium]MDP1541604.1 hemolysin III family protein [Polycyclovorans sp.]MEC8850312.1 hemolysin III family protein [Pseudomonadota bacterium]